METIKKLLSLECDYRMEDGTMDMFLSLTTRIELRNNEPLIPYGKFDDNIYVVKEGLVRYAYFDGNKEKTFAFATRGTVMIVYHSFYMRVPSAYQVESCGKSVVLKISKACWEELIRRSGDFAAWVMRMQALQLYYYEMKTSVISGSARERFEALVKSRPEIIKNVSSRLVASYIGITPQSLCRLKRRYAAGSEK